METMCISVMLLIIHDSLAVPKGSIRSVQHFSIFMGHQVRSPQLFTFKSPVSGVSSLQFCLIQSELLSSRWWNLSKSEESFVHQTLRWMFECMNTWKDFQGDRERVTSCVGSLNSTQHQPELSLQFLDFLHVSPAEWVQASFHLQ